MTSGELRGLTLNGVSTRTPVVVEIEIDGRVYTAALDGYRFEPGPTDADGKPVDLEPVGKVLKQWKGERLVLIGRVA